MSEEIDTWRADAEKVMKSLHERVGALEDAVISQQRIIEAMATDALNPSKIIRPQLRQ